MAESDLSDGMEELQELIDEYKAKETEAETTAIPTELTLKNEEPHNVEENKRKIKTGKLKMCELEVPMEAVVFGNKTGFLRNLAKAVGEQTNAEKEIEEDIDLEGQDVEAPLKGRKRKPAWTDADDVVLEVGDVRRETKRTGPLDHIRMDKSYKDYLATRFERALGAQPKWADLDRKDSGGGAEGEDNSDDELLRTVGFLEKPSGDILQSNTLSFSRLKDLNRATYAEGKIHSIQFHPTSTAALVAGEKCLATIYGIDGRKNEQLHTMHFKGFPIKCARITPCGKKAIFGSYKRIYYVYDLLSAKETQFVLPRVLKCLQHFELSPCGRYMAATEPKRSEIHLFDARSQELVHTFQADDVVAGVQFTGDSTRLLSNAHSCNVSVYSLRQQRLEHSFIDDGCINGSVLHLAPNQRLLATGSMEGVVNVYEFEEALTTKTPKPAKTFLNLTTAISDVKFNATSELLAMCSDQVKDAVRLAHFPSGTIYANFPGFNSNLGHMRCLEFSPHSGYLAFGTYNKVPLCRLKFFKSY